jgi:hypothetical protein
MQVGIAFCACLSPQDEFVQLFGAWWLLLRERHDGGTASADRRGGRYAALFSTAPRRLESYLRLNNDPFRASSRGAA